jgi:succinate dehydrogenase / fumarate reductase flavoprotein subunit
MVLVAGGPQVPEDMEFWQFHPLTGVAGAGVLLTEGCRGRRAILRNSNGTLHGTLCSSVQDLAPRDYVSRCMDQEIKEGRGLRSH